MYSTHPKALESRARRMARQNDLFMSKSRRKLGLENAGEFMLFDSRNIPYIGWHYDATAEEIIEFLSD
jgi:hypothetical protein